MIIRSAILEGSVADADSSQFDQQMRGPVLDAIATYPGIRSVKLRRLVQADAGTPPVYMVFDLYFDDIAAMDAALASPTRGRQCVRRSRSPCPTSRAVSTTRFSSWAEVHPWRP